MNQVMMQSIRISNQSQALNMLFSCLIVLTTLKGISARKRSFSALNILSKSSYVEEMKNRQK